MDKLFQVLAASSSAVLSGAAGTGKTQCLLAAAEKWAGQGYDVIVLASLCLVRARLQKQLAHITAVRVMTVAAFIKNRNVGIACRQIDRELSDPLFVPKARYIDHRNRHPKGGRLLIDEFSCIPPGDIDALVHIAKYLGNKLSVNFARVYVGDRAQFPPPVTTAGDIAELAEFQTAKLCRLTGASKRYQNADLCKIIEDLGNPETSNRVADGLITTLALQTRNAHLPELALVCSNKVVLAYNKRAVKAAAGPTLKCSPVKTGGHLNCIRRYTTWAVKDKPVQFFQSTKHSVIKGTQTEFPIWNGTIGTLVGWGGQHDTETVSYSGRVLTRDGFSCTVKIGDVEVSVFPEECADSPGTVVFLFQGMAAATINKNQGADITEPYALDFDSEGLASLEGMPTVALVGLSRATVGKEEELSSQVKIRNYITGSVITNKRKLSPAGHAFDVALYKGHTTWSPPGKRARTG